MSDDFIKIKDVPNISKEHVVYLNPETNAEPLFVNNRSNVISNYEDDLNILLRVIVILLIIIIIGIFLYFIN